MTRRDSFKIIRFFFRRKSVSKPRYLEKNSWEQEFNYKLWVTKGTRFAAAKRCARLAQNSQLALTILSSYLIVAGISPYLLKTFSQTLDVDVMALITTGTSILLLVYGLLESSKNLGLKAHEYDECALKVSRLYNKLRYAKEFENDKQKMQSSLLDLTTQYDEILDGYENHDSIDFAIFKTQKRRYHGLSKMDVYKIYFEYYRKVHMIYHSFIIIPPLISVVIFWATAKSS